MFSFKIDRLLAIITLIAPMAAQAVLPVYDEPAEKDGPGSTGKGPVFAVCMAGKRIVAVGARGQILTSDDNGANWRQAAVPVSSDLVAVSFPSASNGWAVGHGGVVLHSADGGQTWTKQLSGKQSTTLSIAYYEKLVAQPDGEKLAPILKREKDLAQDSGTPSFLDVHFQSERIGMVVGTFNRIFRTDDGGQTWQPWMDRSDNPHYYNLYAVRERAGSWYLAGEKGMVWRSDAKNGWAFTAIPTDYKGTFFGLLIDDKKTVFAYGMRGNLFRSADAGESWSRVPLDTSYGVTGGAQLPDGQIALAYQAGGYGLSNDDGKTFVTHRNARPMSNFALVPVDQKLLVFVGNQGVVTEPL